MSNRNWQGGMQAKCEKCGTKENLGFGYVYAVLPLTLCNDCKRLWEGFFMPMPEHQLYVALSDFVLLPTTTEIEKKEAKKFAVDVTMDVGVILKDWIMATNNAL